MKEKIYTADDIKILKPIENNTKSVDIDRESFRKNLLAASDHAVEFARTLVVNKLIGSTRYFVHVGASHDGNPLEKGEIIVSENFDRKKVEFKNCEQVIDLLWRDGKVPEWINVSVASESEGHTTIRLECCGRYSSNPDHIYHIHEGRAPFHVLGPPVPIGVDPSAGEKYRI